MATDLGRPTPISPRPGSGSGSPSGAPGAAGSAPPATRAARPGWRDPRLWLGILVVAGCVVAGARIIGAADDTVGVWAVARDAGPGETLEPDDLVATRVHFNDPSTGAGYFTVDQELPADLRLARGLVSGELLPRGALGSAEQADTVEVPVALEADQVPGSVTSGSVVDVYLVAGRGKTGEEPVLAAVTVVDAPPLTGGFSTTGKRQLVLAVPEKDARRFFAALGSTEDPQLTVVRRG